VRDRRDHHDRAGQPGRRRQGRQPRRQSGSRRRTPWLACYRPGCACGLIAAGRLTKVNHSADRYLPIPLRHSCSSIQAGSRHKLSEPHRLRRAALARTAPTAPDMPSRSRKRLPLRRDREKPAHLGTSAYLAQGASGRYTGMGPSAKLDVRHPRAHEESRVQAPDASSKSPAQHIASTLCLQGPLSN
jgi:hypothetical protein